MYNKIGVITLHHNVNYGANLQAFATCKFVNDHNYNCEVVDYRLKSQEIKNNAISWAMLSWNNEQSKSLKRKIKLTTALLISIPNRYKKIKKFKRFRRDFFVLSDVCHNEYDIANKDFDFLICGSDQVWNPDIIEGIDPVFFCHINGVTNKISYAASLGRESYNESDEKKAAELIRKMDYVSVREEKSIDYIKNISGKDVVGVCDPVFLLPKEEYEKITKPLKVKKPYLLVYSVINNQDMLRSAKKYAEQKGLTLVEICPNKKRSENHIQFTEKSPEEFLGAIKNAEIVVTNSFHGTAFSLIFQKEFYVFDNKARGSRITNILNKAGLEGRIVEGEIEEALPIDYEIVNEKLNDYIEPSKQFLLSALSAEKKPLTDNCVGCGACKAVCKPDAISLTNNYGGFIKSYINTDKCVNCGVCQKVCPTINVPQKNNPEKTFAFKAEDEIRKNSTSGGAASALAESIIKNNGSVYGAHLDKDFNLKHIRIDNIEDISLLQGTKYIQSDMTGIFEDLKNDLSKGKPVLFIGTPCQVAAVNNFVSRQKLDVQNLYSCDIICHGVPSPRVFKDYIGWLSRAENEQVTKYYFRNKEFSWRGDSSTMESPSKEHKRNNNVSAFMNLYYSNNITCDACFDCHFTSVDRVSDLTISDFWGIEKENPEFEDALGVSMVMLNTSKGKALFDTLEGQAIDANIENAKQPQLNHPTEKPDGYDAFWQAYKVKGIDYAIKTFGLPKTNLKSKIYNLLKNK